MDKQTIELGLKEHENIRQTVISKKYLLEDETCWQDVKRRIASYVTNKDLQDWILDTENFIPAGSILSGLGNPKKCSLSNCYFTPIEQDSIEGIMDCCKKMARTYSYRGGTGINISILRPKGADVNNSAKVSSGAVSFMPLFSEVTNTIGQCGRRGALMISMDIRHPDILHFIWSKSRPQDVFGKDALTGKIPDVFGANISVAITDDFMEAVKKDEFWDFKYPDRDADPEKYDREWDGDFDQWTGEWKLYHSLHARSVLYQIAAAAWTSGDPGVIYMDTVKRLTPGSYLHSSLVPHGSNPCGEQMLPPYGNCLLGALVLCNYVINPWSDEAEFDKATFLSELDKAVEFLNEMSDINEGLHPLPEQRVMDEDSKRIGLEFTGLADCLAMLGMKYGDEQSIAFISDLLRLKAIQEIKTSNRIAKEKGCCYHLQTPEERNNFLDSPYIKELDLSDEIQDQIMLHGLRNTAFNTVGPTGSLSIVAGNCSSGVEPIYAMGYKRTTRLSDEPFTFIHRPALEWAKEEFLKTGFTYSVEELKKKLNYVESYELRWSDRIRVQSTVQRYTDSSISSTINLPEDCTPEDIFAIYEMGWAYQLKGITVFRDGCKKGVLETTEKKPERKEGTLYIRSLLDIERAERHRVFWKGAKLYITISLDENDHPLEVFVKLPREAGGNGEGYYREELYQEKTSLWDTITRLVTAQLRSGMPLEYIIKQLDKGSYTLTDAGAVLSRILKKYLYQLKEVEQEETGIGDECPECGEMSYIYTGGCPVCQKCGYSNCG